MKKIILILLASCGLLSGSAQSTINHYQRVWQADSVLTPCHDFTENGMSIGIPRSLYDAGSISVKKMKFSESTFQLTLVFEENRVSSLRMVARGKSAYEVLQKLNKRMNIVDPASSCKASCSVQKIGRKYTLVAGIVTDK